MAVHEEMRLVAHRRILRERVSEGENRLDMSRVGNRQPGRRLDDVVEMQRGPLVRITGPGHVRFGPVRVQDRQDMRDAARSVTSSSSRPQTVSSDAETALIG